MIKPVMIWCREGCWYQELAEGGEVRTSFLGDMGTTSEVRKWCDRQGIEFVEWRRRMPVAGHMRAHFYSWR